ncbi:MAG: aminoglycoside phosphotransferase family protein [Pseudomonadales bacterium]
MQIQLPELMKHRASLLGEVGHSWLREVDSLVSNIAEFWGLKALGQLSGGTEALVFLCETHDGHAVMKLGIPGSLDREIRTLSLAEGRGYATLLNFDAGLDAILIERLGDQLAEASMSVDEKIEILCNTLKIAWCRIDPQNGLMSGAEKAAAQADYIKTQWMQLNRPCSPEIIDRALEYATNRREAFDATKSCLIHGDAHIWNTLNAEGSSTNYKFVDPDGLYAEPAIDLAISLREWRDEILDDDALENGRRRCELLDKLTDVSTDAIWQWGFVEHVSCGLLDLNLQDAAAAEKHFDIAKYWVRG